MKLQELMKLRNQNNVKISLQQYTVDFQYNKILKDIRKKGETNIVLEVPTSRIKDVLAEAQKAGMLTEYHNYLITSLDFHTLDLSPFQHSRSNISAFRIVSPDSQYYGREARSWTFGRKENSLKKRNAFDKTALLVDAVNLYARALHAVSTVQAISARSVSCDNTAVWPYGSDLIDAIKKSKHFVHLYINRYCYCNINYVRMKGLTGMFRSTIKDKRTHFTVDLLELKTKGIVKVGEWDPKRSLVFSRNYSRDYSEAKDNLQNITLRVTSIESKPYTMIKKRRLLISDRNYGKKHENGTWVGMIGAVINREVDLAIADLTITLEREEVVDFTMPFMNLGISILLRNPLKVAQKLFSF
ncbi:glutamate receptor ionotropic, kainate 3 [Caerostris extrusa]|uniref:Glutamate receptor ionotropic, kainate 3 n=1 Tax=Caerostris extrusa TaxID=172846 RepID=A0AAV4SJI5_CAEEX|nr:glutamate receptor ionotropic, kainate 3 [Caerostris extrusa]